MSLADHWDTGYLGEGWHHVKITGFEMKTNPSTGNNGVEFALVGVDSAKKAKVMFWLTDAALWGLAGFARDCGMTRDDAARYEPMKQNEHKKLVGMECWIEQEKKGKYHEVVGHRSLAEGQPPPPKIDRSSIDPTTEAKADDIPF